MKTLIRCGALQSSNIDGPNISGSAKAQSSLRVKVGAEFGGMVSKGRFELPTNGLGNRCSIQLSYKDPIFLPPDRTSPNGAPNRGDCERRERKIMKASDLGIFLNLSAFQA